MRLVEKLREFQGLKDVLVLALPRGGVVVGYEVALGLRAPLDVFITRKLGYPGQPELAIGAISETGSVFLNPLADEVEKQYLDREISAQREEISKRVVRYRIARRITEPAGKTIILVDDGLATGATARAAVESLRNENPGQLVLAVPVAPEQATSEFAELVDKFVCLKSDPFFYAVGLYYENFDQVTDEEVTELLRRASRQTLPGWTHNYPPD